MSTALAGPEPIPLILLTRDPAQAPVVEAPLENKIPVKEDDAGDTRHLSWDEACATVDVTYYEGPLND